MKIVDCKNLPSVIIAAVFHSASAVASLQGLILDVLLSVESHAVQFVSHVLPASSENACSKWLEFGVMEEKPLRAMIILPPNSSWS